MKIYYNSLSLSLSQQSIIETKFYHITHTSEYVQHSRYYDHFIPLILCARILIRAFIHENIREMHTYMYTRYILHSGKNLNVSANEQYHEEGGVSLGKYSVSRCIARI